MVLIDQKPKGPSSTAVLIVCCLLSIISMTVWVREGNDGPLHKSRDAFSIVTAPLQTIGNALTSPIRSASKMINTKGLSNSEIEAMQDENAYLRSEVIRLQEYEQEVERLSELYGLSDVYGLEAVGARVISRSTDPWNRTITINKGTNAGVRVGMPVMSANGVIGRIQSAGPISAVVLLITDQSSGVAVYLQATRTDGVMEGSSDGTLFLRYIGLDVNVEPGMTIVTSGLGGVYPKGIPVGTVQSVSFLPSDIYQTITIKPLDRVGSFEEVLVIIGSESEILPGGPNQEGPYDESNGQRLPNCLVRPQSLLPKAQAASWRAK
ncbi:MAG: rod shape-determining protein MreC [Coriobacteriia bacterium]|nr:rod shape-determining protein MreC [Coriobacteriia bacterium]